uniref:Uncharacterized protein n=1 Tax=Ascaris lumbricoides TaxID=6252 RepID=A0A9J2Q745_ASCLU
MVANVRPQSKREIILEDSTILEEEKRTATSFDPRNGSIIAEIEPISSSLSWLKTPNYDISRVLDALKNLNNPMRVRVSECFRVVNRSLCAHNLIAGVWDYGLWPYRKVLIILLRYRIRDCVPTVERAFFARWAANGNGRVDIESAERKDRSVQLILSESNEYIGALAKRNFLTGSQAPIHTRMRRVFATPSLITSIAHAL